MTDELRDRLARIDPMHPGAPTTPVTRPSSRQLLEDIMSTPTKEQSDRAARSGRTWIYSIAAVAALVVAVGGVSILTGGADSPAVAAPVELNAGGEDVIASCIAFSPEALEDVAEIAFEGTVTAVDGDQVTLSIDGWFRGGGESAEVVLNAPVGLEALIEGIPFDVGSQYLISAQAGNVNYCGFSGISTADMRAGFEAAFAQG
jgi:hypothetical protein